MLQQKINAHSVYPNKISYSTPILTRKKNTDYHKNIQSRKIPLHKEIWDQDAIFFQIFFWIDSEEQLVSWQN